MIDVVDYYVVVKVCVDQDVEEIWVVECGVIFGFVECGGGGIIVVVDWLWLFDCYYFGEIDVVLVIIDGGLVWQCYVVQIVWNGDVDVQDVCLIDVVVGDCGVQIGMDEFYDVFG